MRIHPSPDTDQRLLNAILAFVSELPDTVVERFREAVVGWGHNWSRVEPAYLPASEMLEQMVDKSNSTTRELLSLFARERASLHWEQAYTDADDAVGEHMLSTYGYAEIIGKQGPFLSTRVRAGIAVYGPWIDYPPHRHLAEEIYVVLAGTAAFRLGDNEPATRTPGEVIHHPPRMSHGLHTAEIPLVIFYLWKGGDLREKPTFV